MNIVFIYGLVDPRTNGVRYIGYTPDIEKRYKDHLLQCKHEKTYKANWIRSLLKLDLKPEMIILQEVPESEREIAERAWIRYGWEETWRLTNTTEGGGGTLGYKHTEETRNRMSNSLKGRIVSDETRKRLSESHKGHIHSEETRKKMSESLKGKPISEETLKKIGKSHKGQKRSEDACRKMSDAAKERHRKKNEK